MTIDFKERVITYPKRMPGKSMVKGTRITVDLIQRKLSEGNRYQRIVKSIPTFEKRRYFNRLFLPRNLLLSELISRA